MTLFLILLLLFFLLLLGFPLFFLLALATLLGFSLFTEVPSEQWGFILSQKMIGVLNKDPLIAIPLFIFAGVIMGIGGISERIIRFSRSLLGWFPGGLGIAGIFSCVIFAAISGSSPATLVAIGLIMFPALLQHRYPEKYALGVLTSAGSLGIVIPPSIPMIVYAISVEGVSVGNLFLAGFLPGFFLASLLILYTIYTAEREKIPREPFSLREVFISFKEGIFGLLLPVLVLGSIYTGIFTVNEAAAFSVVYALLVSLLIYRELKLSDLLRLLQTAIGEMGAVLIVVATAQALSYFFTVEQIPQKIAEVLTGFVSSKIMFLLMVNVTLLLAGAFMDAISAILVLSPLLAESAVRYGVDLTHLGIITIVNLEIGYLTPPVGINLFVSSGIFNRPLDQVIRSVLVFIALLGLGLLVITYFPPLSLFLVEKFGR